MGVPSFFRWIKERYPSCVVSPDAESHCDNLYIDMNGIIHPCFHPEHGAQPTSYEEVYTLILRRLEELIAVAQPRKVLFLAVDGPAPRAKMNQQRGRRFRASLEAEEKRTVEAALRERYLVAHREVPEVAPPEMDSNVITPGTEFMAMLGRWLRHWAFVQLNAATPPTFRIILSDAAVPGEGEHKAMTFIRAQRHAPGYEPSTHHMIHGMDADLIMLALATHEPRFTILRERQRVGGKGKGKGKGGGKGHGGGERGRGGGGFGGQDGEGESDEGESTGESGSSTAATARLVRAGLEMVQIATLREYLERELRGADWSGVRGGFDLERAIDDFVFLCFFVGNDFLPHCPGLEIREGAIEAMLLLYKLSVSARLQGYLTNSGDVNFARLGALVGQIGRLEHHLLEAKCASDGRERRRREHSERQRELDRLGRAEGAQQVRRREHRAQGDAQATDPAVLGHGTGGAASLGRAGRVLAKRAAELHGGGVAEASPRTRPGTDGAASTAEVAAGGEAAGKAAGEASGAVKRPREHESGRYLERGGGAGGAGGAGGEPGEDEDEELDGGNLEAAGAKRPRSGAQGGAHEEVDEEELDGGDLSQGAPAPPQPLPTAPPPTAPPPGAAPPVSTGARGSFTAELEVAFECASKMAAGEDLVRYGEPGWRERYYANKLGIGPADDGKRRELCVAYVRGLQWVMRYYYQGVPSWTWFFPFHYAPIATDLVGLGSAWGYDAKEMSTFEVGEPFAPLEQLLAVLPPLSAPALPPCLAELMTDPSSPIADVYPRQLQLDLNGQTAAWKAVVLLPFLDAQRLHSVFTERKVALPPADAARNRFGPTYLYVAQSDALAPELWQLAAEHAHRDGHQMARVQQPVRSDPGLLAALTPYPSAPCGARRDPPHPSLPRVEQNSVASAIIRLPSQRLHASVMPPGAQPPPTLHPDARPRSSQEEHWIASLLRGDGGGGGAAGFGGGGGGGGGFGSGNKGNDMGKGGAHRGVAYH